MDDYKFYLPGDIVVGPNEAVEQRALVTALNGQGKSHSQGRIVGYSIVPQFSIETIFGDKFWWRADMIRPMEISEIVQFTQFHFDKALGRSV